MSDHPDSVRVATNREITVVSGEKADYDGSNGYFTTDQSWGATPTLSMTVTSSLPNVAVKKFRLEQVQYQLNPTNTVTYELFLLEASNADNYESASDLVFDSGSAQADDKKYIHVQGGYSEDGASGSTKQGFKLPIIVELEEEGKLYYMINWSAAPATTLGFIKVRGTLLK